MGQKVGKANFVPSAHAFLNANQEVMEALWNNFNEIAEGFGVSLDEFIKICDVPGWGVTEKEATNFFKALDTDENDLIDALEFLTTVAITSGLSPEKKIAYTFRCFDFDESNELSVDEMTLSLKSTLTGLAKLSGEVPPDDLDLEDLSQQAFRSADKDDDSHISFLEYREFCLTNPEVKSWLAYYDDALAVDEPAAVAEAQIEQKDAGESFGEEAYELWEEVESNVTDRPRNIEAAHHPDLEDKVKGEDFGALKPWLATIMHTVPAELPPYVDSSPPDLSLNLEFVHGYRGYDMRNNLFYSASGKIVYPVAALGVSYDAVTHQQQFMMEHTDEVISIAMHPSGKFVATGEVGRLPKIIVWSPEGDSKYIKSEVVLSGYHRRGVIQLAFSPNGRFLASVGQDDDHTLVVYDWQNKKVVFVDRVDKNKVLCMCWKDDASLVTAGVKNIHFWDIPARTRRQGIFGRARGITDQPMLSLVPLHGGGKEPVVIAGTPSGHLYVWHGRNCVKAIKAHESNVYALYSCASGLASGASDGKVRLWSLTLEPKGVYDMLTFGAFNPTVRALIWDPPAQKLLVGTMGCEVFELNAADGGDLHGGPVVQSHCMEEVWGVATHPVKNEFATVGDDGTLRVWDMGARQMVKMAQLGEVARTVTYNRDGTLLAIGLGGMAGGPLAQRRLAARRRQQSGKDGLGSAEGGFIVLRSDSLEVVHQERPSKKPITEVKFSPDSKTLALGSQDQKIYLYDTQHYLPKAKCVKHNGGITHFDFSRDSNFLQSNCSAEEYLFFDTSGGQHITAASAMRDVRWATWTCTLGWPVQGIWSPFADGSHIHALDRSKSQTAVAVGDNFGRLRLYRYPVVDTNAQAEDYWGHACEVTNVKWNADDSYLISSGGRDKAIFQWKVSRDGVEQEEVVPAKLHFDSDDEQEFREDLHDSYHPRSKRNAAWRNAQRDLYLDDVFALEDKEAAEDNFMALKPWLGTLVEPTMKATPDESQPDEDLVLEWVHGLATTDTRSNVRYTSTGEIVYNAAALGVVYDAKKHHQRFFQGHTDDVIALAVHPAGRYVATGEKGPTPKIIVWDTHTLEPLRVLKGAHQRAVTHLAFSRSGTYLASVGADKDHTVVVYDWAAGNWITKSAGDKNKCLDMAISDSGRLIAQVGINHVRFHTLQGRNASVRKGLIGRKGRLQPFACVSFLKEDAVVGTADGSLYRFEENVLAQVVPAHTGPVYSVFACEAGVASGGKDGKVFLWSLELATLAEFDIAKFGSFRPAVRSVQWVPSAEKLLVGTAGAEVYELNAMEGTNLHDGCLLQGHCKDEVWGIAVHPQKGEVATVGDDRTLRIWSLKTHSLISMRKLGAMSRAVAYSPDGSMIAVGLGGRAGKSGGRTRNDGRVLILREKDLEQLHDMRDSKQWISDIKFSPDGNILAVASHDNRIYLYDVDKGFAPRATFSKHNSFVTHMDFSVDGKAMQSSCGGFELLYSDTGTGAHVPAASSFRDTKWATWTVPYGWPVQGIWAKSAEGADINAVDRSNDQSVLAVADEFGAVRLHRWPALSKDAATKTYRGHSSHVRNVKWTRDDGFLISVGGGDRCVFQWRVRHPLGEDQVLAKEAGASGDDSDLDIPLEHFDFALSEAGVGAEWSVVKPWLGTIVAPTVPPEVDPSPPPVKLCLEWVYGYRSLDVRNNARYTATGDIVYHAAGVGIIYDKIRHKQKHYVGHSDDIVSFAVDATGSIVATGQVGPRPRIHLWDAQSGQRLCVLPQAYRVTVSQLAFSPDGKYLLSVADDVDHTLALWTTPSGTWMDAQMVCSTPCTKKKVLFAHFCNIKGGYFIMTGGVRHAYFWNLEGNQLLREKAVFGPKGKVQPVLCAATVGGKVVTGTVTGHLYVWNGKQVSKIIKAHEKTITCLYAHESGLVSGSKDGSIQLWTLNLEPACKPFDIKEARPAPTLTAIRSVCVDRQADVVLVGTQGSELYEITVDSRRYTLRVEGHNSGELWGLETHPTARHIAATAGDDDTVRVWDLHDHKPVARANLASKMRSLGYAPNGALLAVGMGARQRGKVKGRKDGAFAVLRSDTLEVITEGRDSREPISAVRFSPDGNSLAVASLDNKVYVYDARGNRFGRRSVCSGHVNSVKHVDFSANGDFLQSACEGYELLYHKTSNGEQIKQTHGLRDTEWSTWTSPLGWPVQGIWPADADGATVNAVDRSHNKRLLAVADDFGDIRVYNYPCTDPASQCVVGQGHSSHITNVKFTKGDQYILTTGGADRTLMQWRIDPRDPVQFAEEIQHGIEPAETIGLPSEPPKRERMIAAAELQAGNRGKRGGGGGGGGAGAGAGDVVQY